VQQKTERTGASVGSIVVKCERGAAGSSVCLRKRKLGDESKAKGKRREVRWSSGVTERGGSSACVAL